MSNEADAAASKSESNMMFCASCGIAGGDGDAIKLKKCNACYLVWYCSVKCQKEHRPKHKRACKQRAAELRDELLFKQPESSHLGDCPICYLPLSLKANTSKMAQCCSKRICDGCNFANQKCQFEGKLEIICPFCRHPVPSDDKTCNRLLMNRVEINDPIALRQLGCIHEGEGDYKSAFKYLTKAAGLGDVMAHFELSGLYEKGKGVEKDKKKEIHHLEEAAIGGHPIARYNLSRFEFINKRPNRAKKYTIIAANQGHDESLDALKKLFKATKGILSKDEFAAALRAHQAAVDATKSLQREEAQEAKKEMKALGLL